MSAKLGSVIVATVAVIVFACLCFIESHAALHAQGVQEPCSRPSPGGAVMEPEDLRSRDGVLRVQFTIRDAKQSDGSTRYCYVDANGSESPNLRVNPGDLVILDLKKTS